MSNSTRANCDIIINNITLFTGSIDDTSADVKIDLPHHNQISQSVKLDYTGSKVYTQIVNFTFTDTITQTSYRNLYRNLNQMIHGHLSHILTEQFTYLHS